MFKKKKTTEKKHAAAHADEEESKESIPESVAAEKGTDMKSLIEKNIKWSQVIYDQNKKIKNRLTLLVVGNYIRLLLIFIPVIVGIVYLFPFLSGRLEQIEPFFQILQGGANTGSGINTLINNLSPQDVQNIIQSLGEHNQ